MVSHITMDMRLGEWVNVNRNARLVEKSVKAKKSAPKQPPECVYLLQIVGKSLGVKDVQQLVSGPQLACLCSDQVIKLYDQDSLKFVREISRPHGSGKRSDTNEIGFFKQAESAMLFSCGDDGCLKCWDLRVASQVKPAICFDYSADPRAFLCADSSSQDAILGAGTSKSIDDSFVYLFDVRFGKTYLHKLRESHSDDVTQLKFDPCKESRFCSASVDGLVCLYDLNQPLEEQKDQSGSKKGDPSDDESDHKEEDDEDDDDGPSDPDLIEQVFNASSQVQKIGYLSSNGAVSDQMYAITFVNELVIWDLTTHDQIYRSQANPVDPVSVNLQKDVLRTPEAPQEDEFYFFDSFYLPSSQDPVLVKAIGDKRGRMKFVECKSKGEDRVLFETKDSEDLNDGDDQQCNKSKLTRTSHKDIVRSSFWNTKTGSYFTAGEDGFIFKWQMGQVASASQETKRKIPAEVASPNPSKRPNKEDKLTGQKNATHSKEEQSKNVYFDRKNFN